jgi:hypothetical protein
MSTAAEESQRKQSMAIVANRHWMLLALLAGAIVSYSVGFMAGFGLLLVAGVMLELAFWYQLFKRNRRR